MKKLVILFLSFCLLACSSTVSIQDIAGRVPAGERSTLFHVPSSGNPIADMATSAIIPTTGSNAAKGLTDLLKTSEIHVGIAGNSQAINKATVVYALEHVGNAGTNINLYMLGDSQSDKANLEKLANAKNIQLHYFLQK